MVGFAAGLLASAVVKTAIDKLGSPVFSTLTEQAGLLWNFEKDREDMKETMVSMAAVLNDVEKQSVKKVSVRLWLKRLKHVAQEVSDMMDDYEDEQPTAKVPFLTAASKKKSLANKMKKMREKLEKINNDCKAFNLGAHTGVSQEQQHNVIHETTSKIINIEQILGRDKEKKDIMDLLSSNHSRDGLMVLPIYGLGGVGKSTLAQLVYIDTQLKYDRRVWVHVSQEFDLKNIGKSIVSQLSPGDHHNTDYLQCIQQCLDNLLCHNILIILDNIWEEDVYMLEDLKRMLYKEGSVIHVIVTTRNRSIADNICINNKPYELKPLKDDICWEIIQIYSGFEDKSNKEGLKTIGLDIAKKCGGLALAAQALGFTLKHLHDLTSWKDINDSDLWNVSPGVHDSPHNRVLPSLKLSYVRMVPFLKLCFSYCAIFPKGLDICEDDLVHQWVALDFIKTPSEGKKYIKELLGMSFLQHSKLPSVPQELDVTRYTMHDLVHDLARLVIDDELIVIDATKKKNPRELKYCRYVLLKNYDGKTKKKRTDPVLEAPTRGGVWGRIFPGKPYPYNNLQGGCSNPGPLGTSGMTSPLRQACPPYDGKTKLTNILPKKARALHFSRSSKLGHHDDPFSFTKRLRILDFSGCSGIVLPSSLGLLKQIRCLVAPKVQNEGLLHSIGELPKLQYLSLRGSSLISTLPESMGKLCCLTYICLSGCSSILKLPESFGALKSLKHLNMSYCFGIIDLSSSLGHLTNLQHLDLSHCYYVRELPQLLGALSQLQHLNLSSCKSITRLPEDVGNLINLQYLNLEGCERILELPGSFHKLRNLVHLNLSRCGFQKGLSEALRGFAALEHLSMREINYYRSIPKDFTGVMGNLTNLKYLDLYKIDCVPDFICTLTRLEHLCLAWNKKIETLPESIGDLKKLHTLDLSGCWNLRSLPDCIGKMPLKSLLVHGCSPELMDHVNSQLHYSLALPHFKVTTNDVSACSNISLLEGANVPELKICCLENVMSLEEARKVKLSYKNNLSELECYWSSDHAQKYVDDEDLLGELKPPRGLKILTLDGYSGSNFPSWLMGISYHLPNLVCISLERLHNCTNLPPLGQLPNLERLCLVDLPRIRKMDKNFCGGKGAFRRLSYFNLSDCKNLKEWSVTYSMEEGDKEEFMFPVLDQLTVTNCPVLRLEPCVPVFRECTIFCSDKVISSLEYLEDSRSYIIRRVWKTAEVCHTTRLAAPKVRRQNRSPSLWRRMAQKMNWSSASTPQCAIVTATKQTVARTVAKNLWRDLASCGNKPNTMRICGSTSKTMDLFRHFRTLQELHIYASNNLVSLPESMRHLTALQSLFLDYCSGMAWLGNISSLKSLKSLKINGCESIKCLPPCIQQLTKLQTLQISWNPELKRWCELEENKKKLGHIHNLVLTD